MCRPPPKPHEDDATDDTEATHQSKRSRTKSIADQPPTPCELDRRAGNDEARVEKIAGAVSTILEALGEAVARCGVKELNLYGNQLGDEGAKQLAAALRGNETLEVLW